jgi:chemotaxis protein methyltransferase CheR
LSAALSAADLGRFRLAIASRFGLNFDESRSEFLAEVLERRLTARKERVRAYLAHLDRHFSSRDEFRELARELTVGETYFFRHADQLRAFTEVTLPDCLEAAAGRPLRILSAGCASGEEPYSLAMIVEERGHDPTSSCHIRAVDINPGMIEKAQRARYTPWALREAPVDAGQRWFTPEARELVLNERIRRAVAFEERNLSSDDAKLWFPGSYDVVFCRNVLMYFTPDAAERLVARIATALAPGGYLFLGHAETLRNPSSDFQLLQTYGTFYYRRKDAPADSAVESKDSDGSQPVAQALDQDRAEAGQDR